MTPLQIEEILKALRRIADALEKIAEKGVSIRGAVTTHGG